MRQRFFGFRKVREEFHRLKHLDELSGLRSDIRLRYIVWFLVSLLAATVLILFLWDTDMPKKAVLMSGIFVLAGLLWVTEALPLFATAFVVISLEVILIANPGKWIFIGPELSPIDYKVFLNPLADPVIILFLGGFLLAQASVKEGIDKALASNLLKIFGNQPATVMLGLMMITAVFSMWMSNTATTAMMITLTVPLLSQVPDKDPFRKALVLSIPFAANVGGMGTPIASPPNAVAVGFLRSIGIEISFLNWMLIALPLVILMLFIAWAILWHYYKPKQSGMKLISESHKIDSRGFYVMVIFTITIILWLSDQWHGLPTAVVALVPIVAFTATGIIRRRDINSLEWHILILIAGGIALGVGMKATGLDTIIVDLIPQSPAVIFPILIVATILLSTFMSNTAASNLLIPLGISFAAALGSERLSLEIGIGVALAASMAMSLPISTPPNAIAYARGILTSKDFVFAGGFIGVIAIGVILLARWMIQFFI